MRLHVPGQKKPVPAELKDISMGGCFIWASPPAGIAWTELGLGPSGVHRGKVREPFQGSRSIDRITVSVSFRRQPPVIFGTGPIIRRAGDRGFGVRFDDANQDGERFISALSEVALDLRPDFAEQFLDHDVALAAAATP